MLLNLFGVGWLGIFLSFQVSADPGIQQPTVAKSESRRVQVVSFTQTLKGRPGSPDEQVSEQFVVLAKDRSFVDDRSRGLVQILRLDRDPNVLWEISADGKYYRELTDLSEIQENRRVQEKQFVSRLKGLPESERLEMLEAAHIRLNDDGESIREIEVVQTDASRNRDGEKLRHVQVLENGRLIADLWMADLDIPFSLAPLQEASGAFGPEVLKAVSELEGFPLEGTIYVVTATLTHPFEFSITEWKEAQVPSEFFDLPKECSLIESRAFLSCPECGREVERENSAARARNREGQWIYFETRECFSAWKKKRSRKP